MERPTEGLSRRSAMAALAAVAIFPKVSGATPTPRPILTLIRVPLGAAPWAVSRIRRTPGALTQRVLTDGGTALILAEERGIAGYQRLEI